MNTAKEIARVETLAAAAKEILRLAKTAPNGFDAVDQAYAGYEFDDDAGTAADVEKANDVVAAITAVLDRTVDDYDDLPGDLLYRTPAGIDKWLASKVRVLRALETHKLAIKGFTAEEKAALSDLICDL